MNNLHRGLAPISDSAWAQMEEEASRTIKRHLAARRVVDVQARKVSISQRLGQVTSDRSRRRATESKLRNARQRRLSNYAFRSSSRARRSTLWSAARTIQIGRRSRKRRARSPLPKIALSSMGTPPPEFRASARYQQPGIDAPFQRKRLSGRGRTAVSQLRLAGVNGPYALLLGTAPYTAIGGATDDGYPVLQHIQRLVDGKIIWRRPSREAL